MLFWKTMAASVKNTGIYSTDRMQSFFCILRIIQKEEQRNFNYEK